MASEIAQNLHRAQQILEEHDWIKGGGWPKFRDGEVDDRPRCLEGAVAEALGIYMDYDGEGDPESAFFSKLHESPTWRKVRDHLVDVVQETGDPVLKSSVPRDLVWRWNDKDGRRRADVTRLLDTMITEESNV